MSVKIDTDLYADVGVDQHMYHGRVRISNWNQQHPEALRITPLTGDTHDEQEVDDHEIIVEITELLEARRKLLAMRDIVEGKREETHGAD